MVAPVRYVRKFAVLLFALVAFGAAGCGGAGGPERASVTGKVTFDGEPVDNGTIELVPVEGTAHISAGAAIVNGQYAVAQDRGPMLGKHKVVIRAMRKTGKMVPVGGPAGDAMVEESEAYIPAKYNTNTELAIDIKSGENQHDFDLKSQ
jgi:hypothetical protein